MKLRGTGWECPATWQLTILGVCWLARVFLILDFAVVSADVLRIATSGIVALEELVLQDVAELDSPISSSAGILLCSLWALE